MNKVSASLIFLTIIHMSQEIYVNMAFNKKAFVSSGDGKLLVDGDTGVQWVSPQANYSNDWLVIDLKKHYKISYVIIYSACNDCEGTIDDEYMVGMTSNFDKNTQPPIRGYYAECGVCSIKARWKQRVQVESSGKVNCTSRRTPYRYLIVQRSTRDVKKPLAFSEVKVYADVATRFVNIAYSKPAYMGSSASLLYWTAEGCVDGDAMTTCRSQLKDSWLIIDLLEPYKIEKIKFVPELNFRSWDNVRCVVGLAFIFTPKLKPPQRYKYDICGFCSPKNPEKEAVMVKCQKSKHKYRYVILQQKHVGLSNFVVADVEVFAESEIMMDLMGCFKIDKPQSSHAIIHYVEDCCIHCREQFLLYSAFKDKRCHCLSKLPRSPPSPLHSCYVKCPHEDTLCGGALNFHAVYRNYAESMEEQLLIKYSEEPRPVQVGKYLLILSLLILFSLLVGICAFSPLKKKFLDLSQKLTQPNYASPLVNVSK